MLSDLVTKIRNELQTRESGYVQRVDELLADVADLDDPACIGQLLPLFNDDAEHEELMFSLIHTMQEWADEAYVRELIEHWGVLVSQSLPWATIIHFRILNSPSTMAAYAAVLRHLPASKHEVVSNVLESVKQEESDFESRCNLLFAALEG